MSIAAKVYNRILLNRIPPFIDPVLTCNQVGFRTRRRCAEQIFILRRLMEGADDQQPPLFTTFIYFKKGFGTIDRKAMLKVLRHYGIPDPLVEAIKALYTNSKSAVYVDGHLTKEFEVTTGVQAPFLFIIMIDYTMKRLEGNHGLTTAPRRSSRYPKEVVNELNFADDLALLENSFEQAKAQLNTVAEEAMKIGLVINKQKTEFMTNTSCKKNLTLNNADIKLVADFTYLGSKMASSESDIKRRLGLQWSTFWKLERRSKAVPTNLKVNLFKATCLSILLYACEGWPLSKKFEVKLNSYATSCYRIMLGIKRLGFISNEASPHGSP